MYINLVKRENQFKGNAFIWFIKKEDSDRLLEIYNNI